MWFNNGTGTIWLDVGGVGYLPKRCIAHKKRTLLGTGRRDKSDCERGRFFFVSSTVSRVARESRTFRAPLVRMNRCLSQNCSLLRSLLRVSLSMGCVKLSRQTNVFAAKFEPNDCFFLRRFVRRRPPSVRTGWARLRRARRAGAQHGNGRECVAPLPAAQGAHGVQRSAADRPGEALRGAAVSISV